MNAASFPTLLERFFLDRLMRQRQVSPHTISSYRDTFRLLLQFAKRRLHKPPSGLSLAEVDAPLITAFLDDLEATRKISARSRNLRLTAIRSFFYTWALARMSAAWAKDAGSAARRWPNQSSWP